MNTYDKKKKAALIAAAYYMEQERANANAASEVIQMTSWARTGKEIAMNKRTVIQRRGKVLWSA